MNPGEDEICGDEVDNDCDERVDIVDDGDGDGVDRCAGDCDDGAPSVGPGRPEACDGVDTDCDGITPADEADTDGDGERICDGDCDDTDPGIASALPEICDRIDNDCDGAVDEDHDRDLDGYSECGSDCDDQLRTVYPGARLDCSPGADADCDGVLDVQEPACGVPTGAGCTGAAASFGAESPGSLWALAVGLVGLGLRRRAAGASCQRS